jgi:hypothetical protein
MTALLLACILLAPSAPQTEIGEPLVVSLEGTPQRAAGHDADVVASGVLPDTATVQTGTATWCAPTPKYCQSWGGDAMKGAVQSFRYGDTPYRVKVCLASDSDRCTQVTVVSYCACGNTLIDLSPTAFRQLAPLSRGRIRVTMTTGGRVVLPPTSTEVTP